MELVFAGLAGQPGERVVGCVDDGITNGAFLDPLKLAVYILLPHVNGLKNCSILLLQMQHQQLAAFSPIYDAIDQKTGQSL